MAINKTTGAIGTSLSLTNFESMGTAAVYTYSGANLTQIVVGTPLTVVSNTVNYTFPSYSATVFVFTPALATVDATNTSLSASAAQVPAGQTVTFTARVIHMSGTAAPGGTVQFENGGTQLGGAMLNGAGVATFTTSSLAVGTYLVTAEYEGDSNYSSSSSTAVQVAVVGTGKTATSSVVTASSALVASGQRVTLAAQVTPTAGMGTPTGNVAFLDGGVSVGSVALASGIASFATNSLSTGTHLITSTYSGDANFAASTSTAVTVTVTVAATPPSADYSMAMSAAALSVTAGSSGTMTLTITSENGFKQMLRLACSGLPTGATCTFNPASVNPAGGIATTDRPDLLVQKK